MTNAVATLREWLQRLIGAIRRRRGDADLEEELRLHADLAREEGKPVIGTACAMDALRDQRGLPYVDTLTQDVAYGWRQLRRQPGSTAMAVLTLGVGIGATTAIFGIVNAVLLRPLPFDAPEQLVRVLSTLVDGRGNSASYPDFADWRSRTHVFAVLAAFHTDRFTLTGTNDGEALHASCAIVSADLFRLLGARAALGRTFLPDEDRLTGSAGGFVVILSHQLWLDRFGSDPRVLGRTLYVDGRPFTIVGVMPAGFQFPEEGAPDFWIPIAIDFVTVPGTPSPPRQ